MDHVLGFTPQELKDMADVAKTRMGDRVKSLCADWTKDLQSSAPKHYPPSSYSDSYDSGDNDILTDISVMGINFDF